VLTRIERLFRDALARDRMVRRGERVLVAVSGGPDSTALLSLFVRSAPELGVTLHVAHLDHGWRASSARDAEFVRRLALRFGIPVTVGHVDPAAWKATSARPPAGERRQSSLEARARTLRQRFLRATAAQVGATRIALGHTLDDQAETLLLRLLRGSGARGLAGIHPVVDGLFIRPLLGARRADILSYLKARRLTWRRDPTNRDLRLTRNRVRHRLLPLLERSFNAAAVPTLARAATLLRDEDAWMEDLARAAFERCVRPSSGAAADPGEAGAASKGAGSKVVSLDAVTLEAMPAALQRRVVRLAFKTVRGHLRGLGFRHVEQALLLTRRPAPGGADLPGGLRLRRTASRLEIRRAEAGAATRHAAASCREALCPVPGEVSVPDFGLRLRARCLEAGDPLPEPGPDRALLDADRIEAPLLVRPRRPGDRFVPLGGPGTRRLKSFLIDRKVPVDARGHIPLVVSGERIAWVVGHRIDDRFKITPRTRRVLVLEKETR
jgi:tRNA(Ile)-lysidine synthase